MHSLATLAVVFAVAVLDDVATNGSVAPGGGGDRQHSLGHSTDMSSNATRTAAAAVETNSRPPSSTLDLDMRVKRSTSGSKHRHTVIFQHSLVALLQPMHNIALGAQKIWLGAHASTMLQIKRRYSRILRVVQSRSGVIFGKRPGGLLFCFSGGCP